MDYMTFLGAQIMYNEAIKKKLEEHIIGKISTDYSIITDCIRVTISNRGFIFKYTVYEISHKIQYCVTSDSIANEILKAYIRQINRTFFKK